jgi:hypothetical protein
MSIRSRYQWSLATLLALTAVYIALGREDHHFAFTLRSPATEEYSDLASLFRKRQSGVVVNGVGIVEKILPDDREGSMHQRFILRLAPEQTLLVSHNIDLAPRVEPLRVGDEVRFRGQYEWNDRGGLVHWTHHDPAGDRPGGWLEHANKIYR